MTGTEGREAGERSVRPRSSAMGFSLVELVVVIVIIGIIAAIAVPRFSQASQSATKNALAHDLTVVREAMERYHAEHGRYPGYNPGTGSPDGSAFVKQLLQYTDEFGATSPTFSSSHIYGPYLRDPFPANPFNELRTVFVKSTPATAAPGADSSGWVAVLSTGSFRLNAKTTDLTDIGMVEADATEMVMRTGS